MSEKMVIQQRFKGKKVLVTGAAGGIGSVLAASLRKEGALVAVTDLDTSNIKADAHFDGDLLDPSFCDLLPSRVAKHFNGIDILFNNAGVITRGKITDTSEEDYSLTMGVNVEAPFRLPCGNSLDETWKFNCEYGFMLGIETWT